MKITELTERIFLFAAFWFQEIPETSEIALCLALSGEHADHQEDLLCTCRGHLHGREQGCGRFGRTRQWLES